MLWQFIFLIINGFMLTILLRHGYDLCNSIAPIVLIAGGTGTVVALARHAIPAGPVRQWLVMVMGTVIAVVVWKICVNEAAKCGFAW